VDTIHSFNIANQLNSITPTPKTIPAFASGSRILDLSIENNPFNNPLEDAISRLTGSEQASVVEEVIETVVEEVMEKMF
jgi:hypothetical protein